MNKNLFEQAGALPYDPDYEMKLNRFRYVDVLGTGAFGQVFLYQAFEIADLNPRDKSEEARKKREKMWKAKDLVKRMDDIVLRDKMKLVAVKMLKG